jgi:predicted NUDIX family phosphoesterase
MNKKTDEKILVVPTSKFFTGQPFSGLHVIENFDKTQETIEIHKEFLWRSEMEIDVNYKQIIPYLVFSYDNKFFLMQRKSNASETRLQNKYSLGIGGHIKQEDISGKNIFDWARREFAEEIEYTGSFSIEPIGLINDESNAVGQVHLGCAFLLKGDSGAISIKSELKQGNLLSLQECAAFYENMETWSQIVFNFLIKREN